MKEKNGSALSIVQQLRELERFDVSILSGDVLYAGLFPLAGYVFLSSAEYKSGVLESAQRSLDKEHFLRFIEKEMEKSAQVKIHTDSEALRHFANQQLEYLKVANSPTPEKSRGRRGGYKERERGERERGGHDLDEMTLIKEETTYEDLWSLWDTGHG